ncbi:MAG: DNRLRE domain-containing protein [Actinomycetales bacterium]
MAGSFSRVFARVPTSRYTRLVTFATAAALVLSLGDLGATGAPARAAAGAGASAQAKVTSRPDRVSAALAARLQGSRVEVSGLRTERSETWVNPDGSLTTEASPTPQRVQQADGSWVPLDLNLQTTKDGFAPKASIADVTFSAGGAGAAVLFARGSRKLGLSWSKALPAPTISGSSATYAINENMSLVLSATPDGFEQSVVLQHAPSSALALKLPLALTRLSAVSRQGGGFDLTDTNGTAVLSAAPPLMYDAQRDESGSPSNRVALTADVSATSGDTSMTLTPAMSFLTDPSTVYPVTIDPVIGHATGLGDTFIKENDSTAHGGDYNLGIGNTGANKMRTLIKFADIPGYMGGDVTNATLQVYNYLAYSCTNYQVDAYPVTSSFAISTATWANQPTVSTSSSYAGGASFSHGYATGGCLHDYANIDVTKMTQAWAAGTLTNYGIELRAHDESTSAAVQRKYLCSGNPDPNSGTSCTTSTRSPILTVTYNSIPSKPSTTKMSMMPSVTTTTSVYVSTSYTPSFTASVSNSDGGAETVEFQVVNDPAYPAYSWTGTVANVTPGAPATVKIPTANQLTSPARYQWRARGSVVDSLGGTDYGTWSDYVTFAMNVGNPAAPSISCTPYSANAWTALSGSASCTLDTASTDGAGYYWSLDDPSPADGTLVNDTSNSGAAKTISFTPTLGQHTLYALARDNAFHQSAVTTYTFGAGSGGVLTPADQSRTQAGVALTAQSGSGYNQVTYQYRQGTDSSVPWITIPTGDVTPPGSGTPISSWPQSGTTSGSVENYSQLNWNLAATVHTAGGGDGPVQVQACFQNSGGTSTCTLSNVTNVATVTLATTSFADSAATQDVGAGTVSLNTGDFQVDETDASQAGLSIGRTATTLSPPTANTGPTGVFGAGWTASVPGPDGGAGDYTLVDNSASGYVTLKASDGTSLIYQHTTGTGTAAKYVGTGDANDGSLLLCTTIVSGACTTWVLTDVDTTTTTWTKTGSTWTVSQIVQPGAESTTTYTRDGNGRVTRILAPVATGVTCGSGTSLSAGCQALFVTYATSTTATGTGSGQWGDYTGLVSGISYEAYDPATTNMATVQVASYQYDSTGHLRAAWDPRISPALKTTYAYDSNGRITTLTPPGRAAWTIDYDDSGRVVDVSRTDPTLGAEKQAVAYGVPVTGTGAPIDLFDSSTGTASWAQSSDLPYAGAAVFPASKVPASVDSHGDYQPSSGEYAYADLTYTDINGRTVDSASYGAGAWQIDSTRYDANGNVTWQLDALGRANALSPTADTDAYVSTLPTSSARADLLATVSTYTADGVDLLTTEGPAHQVQLSGGAIASVRTKTSNTYDQSGPTTICPCHLVTTTTTSPDVLDGTTVPSADTKTTQTGYDPIDGASNTGPTSGWVLHAPTTQTTPMPGTGNDIVTKSRYDSSGRMVEARMPASSGSDAGTTLTTYYTASGTGTCGGKPQWAGLVCHVAPAAQPGGTTIPSSVTTYDLYGATKTVTETSGTTTRVTTNTYDAAGRPTMTSLAVTPSSDGGTAVPDITTGYDASTGDATSVTDGTSTISIGYNSLGQQNSYADADGNNATTTYDIDGNVATHADGKGTYTYTYDGTDANGKTEHRGLVTSLDTGMGSGISTFTGGYDAGGDLTTQTYPNGLMASTRYDDTGEARSLTYAKSGATWLTFTSTEDNQGETVGASSAQSEQDYTYDNAGRLTSVADTNLGQCTSRTYAFGKESTRTSLTTAGPDANGLCQTGTSTTANSTFDSADRITNTGYVYDKFGRTTTVPAADLSSGSNDLSVGYYANDMVASQTQGTSAKTFTLDPARRLRAAVDSTSSSETRRILNHYDDTGDSPSWVNTSTDAGTTWSWERNVQGLDGNLAALQDQGSSTPILQLTNLHGDVIATVPDDTGATGTDAYFESTEYGAARDTNATSPSRYGWLGGKQRSTDDLAGVVLMGARLYNPATGRFLSVDPEAGGSANDYAYPTNPIDGFDLDGRHWWGRVWHAAKKAFWATDHFFSYRDDIDAVNDARHGRWSQAWRKESGWSSVSSKGTSAAASGGSRWAGVGRHLHAGTRIGGHVIKKFAKWGTGIGVAATAVDYGNGWSKKRMGWPHLWRHSWKPRFPWR